MTAGRFLRSLRGQLTLIWLALLLLVVALFSVFWIGEESHRRSVLALSDAVAEALEKDKLVQRGQRLAGQFADNVAQPMVEGDAGSIGLFSRATLKQPDVQYVIVFDRTGKIVNAGDSTDTVGRPMVDPLADAALLADTMKAQWTDDLLDVAVPVRARGERIGGVRVGMVVNKSNAAQANLLAPITARLELASRSQHRWVATMLVLVLLFGASVVYLLDRRILEPIRNLGRIMAEDKPGQSSPMPVDSERADEIGDLMRAFHRMRAGMTKHDRDIRRMAYTDPLTGLANRLSFRELLDDRLLTLHANSGELALLFIDLDDFKRVNDTLGHEAGDEVLSQLSARLRLTLERVGANATDIARFGGDEFTVLYRTDDIRSASARLSEALLEEIQRPLVLAGKQVFLGASIGITMFPFDAYHAGQLLKNADIAMYQAKVAGKNCYRFYSRAMDQAVERRVQLEQDLRGAWDRGELSIAYQPIYSLNDTCIRGAEALLRWNHPQLGMVPPSVFIEVAEQSGLIEGLGRNVLERACEDAARWRPANGSEPFVSVNISPRQLRSGELPDVVGNALANSGLLAHQLHLELTETAVLVDEAQASALLSRVRATGVKVWLDDFGTGFSGLSHLRRVPVDGVKIDRSFVADMLRDPDDLALTTAIIAMAHSLGIIVVAEGIETEGQCAVLRERGCDQGQGFWFGRPMSADDLIGKLQ
ncbi:MAG: EAL domain-containing protein [Arenimonas sp.]|nr:EAL domain-containing protein [Arenimonas sp.]